MTTQEHIDGLITTIWNAQADRSVTNIMVARVLDWLNDREKELKESLYQVISDQSGEFTTIRRLLDLEESSRTQTDSSLSAQIDELVKRVTAIQGVIDFEELDNMYGPAFVLKKAAMEGNGPFRFIVMRNGRNSGFVDVIGDSLGHNLTQILTTHDVAPDFKTHTDERVHTYVRTYVLSKGTLPEAKGTWTEWREQYADLMERLTEAERLAGLATAIEIESEEEMERMIAAGECVEGQMYYIAEEE